VSEGASGAFDATCLALVFKVGRKSIGAADAIWFFLGFLRIHRFYLGRTWSDVGLLVLLVVGLFMLPVGIGALLWLALGVWWLIDVALIPGIVGCHDAVLPDRLSGASSGQI
jgi:TM2 domain-containing membrane protein YozV